MTPCYLRTTSNAFVTTNQQYNKILTPSQSEHIHRENQYYFFKWNYLQIRMTSLSYLPWDWLTSDPNFYFPHLFHPSALVSHNRHWWGHLHVQYYRVVKCHATKITIWELMGEIIQAIKTKNVSLPKSSRWCKLSMPHYQLRSNDSVQILLKMAWFLTLGTKTI